MNRTFVCAAALLLVIFEAAPASGQVPLVVGAVRDQHGAPIEGAVVTSQPQAGTPLKTTTQADGTFALAAAGIAAVLVSCRYCRAARFEVRPGEPVVAIVLRYDALAADSPSTEDLANLPYAHVESAVALHPFTLLAQSSLPQTGSSLSDRGLSPSGSLTIENGAPVYDVTSGISPYTFLPAQYARGATLGGAADAFAYGDQAGGGTVSLDPLGNGSSWQVASLGSDAIGRAQLEWDGSGLTFGSFSNSQESRQRADLNENVTLDEDQSLEFAAGSADGRTFAAPQTAFGASFSFADAAYQDPGLSNLTVSAVTDRGTYQFTAGEYPQSAAWSDSAFTLGAHSNGPVQAFADIGTRASSGFYDELAQPYGERIGATLAQTRADAGIQAGGSSFNLRAGAGAFWIDYGGGPSGFSQAARAALAVPSIQAQLFPNGKWTLDLQESGSFTLPTFVQQYSYFRGAPTTVALERNGVSSATLSYTDDARLRFSFEQTDENVGGAASGRVTSTGFSAVWQIAPLIALRAWTMHVTDTVPLYGVAVPLDQASPTVNAFWLTYGDENALRFDAIYRRDLLDGLPFEHVDGAISGPIANHVRWYAGVEDRLRRTFLDAGLRISGQ